MAASETAIPERTSTITSKGQVTIPVEIRRLLGLKPSDRVAFRVIDSRVEIASANSVVDRTAGMLRHYARPKPASVQEERAAFEQAVADQVAASLEE